jgi:hypothetical protein
MFVYAHSILEEGFERGVFNIIDVFKEIYFWRELVTKGK